MSDGRLDLDPLRSSQAQLESLAQDLSMESKLKPIPAFYCCYLLRSTIRHSNLYIGSTPHPSRRLAQHNGKSKGGAVRTSRLSLRPWEMVCVIAGFPSNIAALQFEWAWHNPHLTRHIPATERISIPVTKMRMNNKTGKTRKKLTRPRTSLTDKLLNLHLLLRSAYFSGWPLELRFFCHDVYRRWNLGTSRIEEQLRPDIKVLLDQFQPAEAENEPSSAQKSTKRRKADLIGKGGVEGVDPTYARYQNTLHKLNNHLESQRTATCFLCEEQIDGDQDLFNICVHGDCDCITHVECLSEHFLGGVSSERVVPQHGGCPACKADTQWLDLMTLLSIRTRAEKEVRKLLRARRTGTASVAAEMLEEEDSDDEGSSLEDSGEVSSVVDVDDIHDLDSSDSADSVTKATVTRKNSRNPSRPRTPATKSSDRKLLVPEELVIADSEEE